MGNVDVETFIQVRKFEVLGNRAKKYIRLHFIEEKLGPPLVHHSILTFHISCQKSSFKREHYEYIQ